MIQIQLTKRADNHYELRLLTKIGTVRVLEMVTLPQIHRLLRRLGGEFQFVRGL
jgi:hypothetical protein